MTAPRPSPSQAVQAEVVDPNDPSTALNLGLIDQLQMRQGAIVFAGEAASHCVNYTVAPYLLLLLHHK